MIAEAQKSGLEIVESFRREGEHFDFQAGSIEYVVDSDVMDGLAMTQSPQGVIALVRPPHFELENILSSDNPLLVVLCGVQDPGNVGTILRLSEAFGATGCVTTPGTVGPYNGKMVRATSGSLFRIPSIWNQEFDALGETMRGRGVRLAGAGADGTTPIDQYDWSAPTAILIGNESRGLSPTEREACATILSIPQGGEVGSLNAATAAAVILYEAARQRRS